MPKTLLVAWREFAATVFTKGFILGVIMTPVMLVIVVGALAMVRNLEGPQIVGTVALIDRSGTVAEGVQRRFGEDAVAEEAKRQAEQVEQMMEQASELTGGQGNMAMSQARAEIERRLKGPNLTLEVMPPDASEDAIKEELAKAEIKTKGQQDHAAPASRLALIVVPPEAVTPTDGTYAPFLSYFADKLDFEIQARVRDRVEDAIVEARLATDPRIAQTGLRPQEILTIVRPPQAETKTIDEKGEEKKSIGELRMLLPMGFMILLMTAVFTGGQGLLTSTVEEKANRVMEVLLSAVSPRQIMVGKILGQMCVGLVILVLYTGIGAAAVIFALKQTGLISAMDIVYLLIFFVIAYFLVASMMAAIGAAVNDMREAQTLLGPVMVVLMLPWLCWFLIQRAPNSTFATVLSFIPGINPFIMVIRLAGSEPIPAWQIPVGILIGVVSVLFAGWAAAKVFRVGLLMYGKPPDFKTLVRWIKMA